MPRHTPHGRHVQRALLHALLSVTLALPGAAAAQDSARLRVPGLEQPVEIIRDRWGINHIYAQSEHDLFFAQGYAAAKDRIFQFEVWRRQATGTVAEWLGPRELERDIGARLFKFRGDLTAELNHYHPRGASIITAFVDGINAYVAEARRDPGKLPIEFRLLNTLPEPWTPDVVISRHQGLLGNLTEEFSIGRAVAALGPARVKALSDFGPGDPDLALAAGIDSALLAGDVLKLYNAFRETLRFRPEDIIAEARAAAPNRDGPPGTGVADASSGVSDDATRFGWTHEQRDIGSNNWVVSGRLTESGYPIMANDPHRALSAPSLRYFAHLVAPGWNVIGGGEPVLPGISIGHNEHGAWGLTIFSTDGEDLLVYDTDPSDPDRYRFRDGWERMRIITDTIKVKGRASEIVQHRYTRHGPVVSRDAARRKAFAVRAAWMEIGGAPYLASLRMDQATTWEEFREANRYSHIPGENMIWADRQGHIGWQAVGIAPRRRNFSGLVPVPGDGRFEWDGYLDILLKPSAADPAEGFLATANNDLIPRDYPHMDAIGFSWADPYRFGRASEVLASGRRHSLSDMARLQTDELAIPARQLVPLLRDLPVADARVDSLRRRLLAWDHVLARSSVEAGVYAAWELQLRRLTYERMVQPAERAALRSVSLRSVVSWLHAPPAAFGGRPLAGRDSLLVHALVEAEATLRRRFGSDVSDWAYGRDGYHHALIRHPLSAAVNAEMRARLDVGPLPRGGYGNTLNATGNSDNQGSGASFRLVVDLVDWDLAIGTNTPGQGGDASSRWYRDLFADWSRDRFFPVVYSRPRVQSVAAERVVLEPR
jgi:penicillin G amidase